MTSQRIVPDATIARDRVLAQCRKALVRKARIEGYAGVDLNQVTVTYRAVDGRVGASTVVCMEAPAVGDRRTS